MTATAVVTASEIYRVKDGFHLALDIVVGEGQPGGSSVIWLTEILDFPPKSWPYVLATDGGTVRTKTLHCTTRVRDVNPNSNRTSVTYKLSGGEKDQDFSFWVSVPKENDYATYVIDFTFF